VSKRLAHELHLIAVIGAFFVKPISHFGHMASILLEITIT